MLPLLATSELDSIVLEEVRRSTLVLGPEKGEDTKERLEYTLQVSAVLLWTSIDVAPAS